MKRVATLARDAVAPSRQLRSLAGFSGAGYNKGRGRVWQGAWQLCNSLVFRRWWLPARARASLLRAFGATLGTGVLVRHDVTIHWPWKLSIGDHSWVGVGVWILNLEPVTIGSHACLSQGVLVCTGSHDHRSPTFEFDNAPIVIGDGVWLAARATVLRGVTIGAGALVGACALVAQDVEPFATIVAPAGQPR